MFFIYICFSKLTKTPDTMNKIFTLFVLASLQQGLFSQEKSCNKPKEEIIEDLNSITKCDIEKNSTDETSKLTTRNSKRITIQVSSRRRVIRRKKSVSSVGYSAKSANKLEKIKNSTSLVGKLELSNKGIAEKLPFDFVEEKPSFSDCKDVATETQGECFKNEILQHIKRNFKYPQNSYDKSIQGRVLVQFVIDEFGIVNDIITRGPLKGEELEAEAKRIIRKLPKFRPGKIAGNTVKVKYGIPINFKIPGKAPSNVAKKSRENVVLDEVVNFASVQNIPLFKGCENSGSDDDKLNCFNKKMTKHVKKYFAYPEDAAKNNISGRVYAYFVIDKQGDVVNIKTRGPKNGELLEYATKKLVEKLPKFIPGKQNGKATNVKYAFPINFKLN